MIQAWLREEFAQNSPLHELILYHLRPGGKCLRGHLALLECARRAIPRKRARAWALACELLHNATLIHDDIQDKDQLRRGQPSLWWQYGVAQAINAGDLLIFRAFLKTAELGSPPLITLVAKTAEELVQGQAQELKPRQNQDLHWKSYCEMAQQKTGALFTLPIAGAALLAGKPLAKEELQRWSELGLAYQIFDDLRDYHGLKQAGQWGKDFEERRINSLIAYLSQFSQSQDLLRRYLSGENFDMNQLHDLLDRSGTLTSLRLFAEDLIRPVEEICAPEVWSLMQSYFSGALTKVEEIPSGQWQ